MTSAIEARVSSPTKSASVRGPIGWLAPAIMPVSMSSIEPTPCSWARIASSMYGTRSRLTMKPRLSFAATVVLPSVFPISKPRS